MSGILYIVATPIGNLSDITFRAIETLQQVDVIAAEDTRMTKRLLDQYDVDTPMMSVHQHSSNKVISSLVGKLVSGANIALVSDAGTPGISDPGNKVVAAVREAGVQVVPIPGVSAVIALLSVSGLPTDSFVFYGFVPHKKGRQTLFEAIAAEKRTSVFYDSPHRIVKTLEQLGEHLDPERTIVIGRELTKQFEEIISTTTEQLPEILQTMKVKGEFVVAVSGVH